VGGYAELPARRTLRVSRTYRQAFPLALFFLAGVFAAAFGAAFAGTFFTGFPAETFAGDLAVVATGPFLTAAFPAFDGAVFAGVLTVFLVAAFVGFPALVDPVVARFCTMVPPVLRSFAPAYHGYASA